ncbi:hypothetical protein DL767_000995 [Monosporascus sp. MG133]|nr:hypothetical protein DL767_000995 [Monosporascus sp. MG133]
MAHDISSSERDMAWLQAHAHETLVPNMIVCASVCSAATVAFVVLRLRSRWIMHGYLRLEASDWLILISFLFFAAFVICFGLTTLYGAGRHAIAVTDRRKLQILSLLGETIYFYSMAFIKLSILSLYARIFPSRRFRWYLWGIAAFMVAWALQGSFVTVFQCTPIEYGWNRELPGGRCINYGLSVLISGIANIITDFVILCAPIPLVLRLQVTPQKKRLLIFTFALGGSLRLGEFDGTWTGIPAAMINIVELMAGILAASIPTYRPLYRRWLQRGTLPIHNKSNPRHYYHGGERNNSRRNNKSRASDTDGGFGDNALPHSVEVKVGCSNRAGDNHGRILSRGINVTEQIELVRHVTNANGTWVRVPDDDEVRLYNPNPSPAAS